MATPWACPRQAHAPDSPDNLLSRKLDALLLPGQNHSSVYPQSPRVSTGNPPATQPSLKPSLREWQNFSHACPRPTRAGEQGKCPRPLCPASSATLGPARSPPSPTLLKNTAIFHFQSHFIHRDRHLFPSTTLVDVKTLNGPEPCMLRSVPIHTGSRAGGPTALNSRISTPVYAVNRLH